MADVNPNPAPQSAAFKQAAQDVMKLKAEPSPEDKLKIYALYKVGKDEDFSKVSVPWAVDIVGSRKYKAWKEKVDAKLGPGSAQKQYVELVEKLKIEKGFSG